MTRTEAIRAWSRVGSTTPADLAEARVQSHWAVQILASSARQLLEAQPDDSHTSLTWVGGRLATQQFTDGRRLALDPGTLTLAVLSPGGTPGEELRLAGASLGDGMRWASERVAGGSGLRLPVYDMPDHAVRSGGTFPSEPGPAFVELRHWYANAAAILEVVRAAEPDASPVRCWPHHFDIATLVNLDAPGDDPEGARSIGIGLSPGDDSIPEPYFYVTPWPAPSASRLPEVPRGRWHTQDFTAAVLQAGELGRVAGPADQATAALDFLDAARAAARRLLAAD